MMKLQDSSLLRTEAYIDGVWIDAVRRFAVVNPADGSTLATVPDLGAEHTRQAIGAAARAWDAWKSRPAKERSAILRRWFDLIMANQEDLATLLTAEQGKPLAEAKGEIAYGASFVEWFAEEAKRVYGDIIPANVADRRLLVTKEPIGVVAAITPWNFPNAMITRKCAPALAVGCPVVVKPAEDTPLSALALAVLAERAGIPAGVFNVVTASHGAEVGGELTSNPLVRKLSFTGSTEVGKLLMAQCAATVKKVSLELGGNAPFIIFDDADLDRAVAGAMASKYRNAGQTCVCANRFLVQDGIHDAFVARLSEAVEGLTVGPGLSGPVTQGPLINQEAVEKVERLLADALAKGAKLATGGQRHALGHGFFQPTILTGVTPQMDIAQQEIFGPVAAIQRFAGDGDAVELANATPYGLAAYFYTRDNARVWRVSSQLEYGIIGINEGIFSTEVAPFGGVKESGLGREGSKYGIEDFLEIKFLCVGGL